MKHQLFYVTDTYCCWCFGFSETMDSIAKEYTDKIDINVINGGMIANDFSLEKFFSRFPDPIGLHKHISATSGQQFGSPYLSLIKNLKDSNRNLNSSIPAKAIIAFKQLGVDGLVAAKEIQNAHYLEGIDLQKIESYKTIAKKLNVTFDQFSKVFSDSKTTNALNAELQLVRKLRIQGFPAILLKNENASFSVISNGFLPYAKLKIELDNALAKVENARSAQGNTCTLDAAECN